MDTTEKKLIPAWGQGIPAGYKISSADESTGIMVVVPDDRANGRDIKAPCLV